MASLKIWDSQTNTYMEIPNIVGQGGGDMLKSVYDTDNDGIVDNAEKVNNHTVDKDVPADAVFTDTTYSEATTAAAGLMSATDKTKLDSVETGATADMSASEILTAIKTVDGAGSGLDADLLDGKEASAFILANTKGADSGVASLTSDTKVTPSETSAKIIEVTASKTLALTDAGTLQQVNSTSSVIVTIPLNSAVAFPIGTEIEIVRYNTGAVTIAAGSGVTIVSTATARTLKSQYSVCTLKKMAVDTWLLTGDLG